MTEAIRKIVNRLFGKDLGSETIRYILVGALTTLVNFGSFELLHSLAGLGVNVSNIISISISVIFAYVANKLIVFMSRSGSYAGLALEFLKFVGSRLFTIALEIGAVALFYNVLGADARLGKIASQALVITTNYFTSKLLVFNKNKVQR